MSEEGRGNVRRSNRPDDSTMLGLTSGFCSMKRLAYLLYFVTLSCPNELPVSIYTRQ